MVNIVDVRDVVVPIRSDISNAFIDFSSMTVSVVAVVTDVSLPRSLKCEAHRLPISRLGVCTADPTGSDWARDKSTVHRRVVAYSPLRKRQSGWPAGSSMMRMRSGLRSGGCHGTSVPPALRAVSTAASRSSTSISK